MTDETCDLILDNARILDGLGSAPSPGGVAITGDRIVAAGDMSGLDARRRIDLDGLCLAPGFIDTHTHDDRAVLDQGDMTPRITQGVTTVMVGNCGISLAPCRNPERLTPPMQLLGSEADYRYASFAEYRRAVEAAEPAVNVAALAGHGTMRAMVMKDVEKPADAGEIDEIRRLLREALEAGVFGLSTGLAYPVARAAPTGEIVAIARELAAFPGARYVTHMRDERDEVVQSVQETLRIGAEAGVPVVVSHHKCIGKSNHGRSVQTLALIDAALGKQDVALDVYPYIASSTVLLPELTRHAERIIILDSENHPELNGRDLDDVADAMGCDRETAAARVAPAVGAYFQMSEQDLTRIMRHPRSMIASDGIPGKNAHPRLWGTFPRVLGRYVREEGTLSLPEAVRKMTSLPAQVFGLARRGRIQAGFHADLTAFDPDTVLDMATFEEPELPSRGVAHVFVNGVAVVTEGRPTADRPGRYLTRGA